MNDALILASLYIENINKLNDMEKGIIINLLRIYNISVLEIGKDNKNVKK